MSDRSVAPCGPGTNLQQKSVSGHLPSPTTVLRRQKSSTKTQSTDPVVLYMLKLIIFYTEYICFKTVFSFTLVSY